MNTRYKQPTIEVVEIEIEGTILAESNELNIGATLPSYEKPVQGF